MEVIYDGRSIEWVVSFGSSTTILEASRVVLVRGALIFIHFGSIVVGYSSGTWESFMPKGD